MNRAFKNIENRTITDIVQVGVVDVEENGIGEMTTFHTHLYLYFGEIILKLESIDQYSKLRITIVGRIEFKLDFEIEEEMIPVKNSIAEIVLTDTLVDNRIVSIDLYGAKENFDGLICDALAFHLVCGQLLFFDPTYLFGINIGGIRQQKAWLDNYPNGSEVIVKETVELLIPQ